jgi:hypothetical protein
VRGSQKEEIDFDFIFVSISDLAGENRAASLIVEIPQCHLSRSKSKNR